MRLFSWVTKDTNINFMKAQKLGFVISGLMVALAIACIAIKGFNYGIDFSGGILMEVKAPQQVNIEEMRNTLSHVDLDDINIQTIGESGDEVMIRAQAKEMNEKEQMAAINAIKSELGTSYEYRRVELVGPQVGDELKLDGVIASVIAVLAITLYIWVRFEWQFALGAMIGLIHDLITILGLLSLFGFDFSLTTVAAILTPPDVFSQLLMAGPMLILYEVSIYVAAMARPRSGNTEVGSDKAGSSNA